MDAALIALAVVPLLTALPAPVTAPATAPMLPAPYEVAAMSAPPRAQDPVYDARYYRHLELHRFGTKALLPLFALQYLAGSQLADEGADAPGWAKVGHRVGATGVAALFIKNVYSGLPILAASARDPQDKGRRFTHVTMMLLATAGFTYTGILSDRAEGSPDDRAAHKNMALTSMGIATFGYLLQTDIFRRD
jgi:hypothetical protein